jgi:hypothetical protein
MAQDYIFPKGNRDLHIIPRRADRRQKILEIRAQIMRGEWTQSYGQPNLNFDLKRSERHTESCAIYVMAKVKR